MNHAVASADSRFLSHLREQGIETSYFEERVVNVVIPHINSLATNVREVNGFVVWIRPEWRTATGADWPIASRPGILHNGFDAPSFDGLASFALLDDLATETRDHFFSSFSTSAFWGSPLLATLRNLKVTDVIITGCFTDSAVVINALDSTNTGFLCTVVEDACASISEERHVQSLALHSRLFRLQATIEVQTTLTKELQ